MRMYNRLILSFCILLVSMSFMGSCSNPKEGKAMISTQQFSQRKDNKFNWVIDATGTVKNVGETDLKNVVVTADCESCGEVIFGVTNTWSVASIDKRPEQMDRILYLSVNEEKEFKFTDVAFMMRTDEKIPDKMPELMKCKIVSFEVVQK